MSKAKKLFDAQIESLRKSAKGMGLGIADVLPQIWQPPPPQPAPRSLADVLEQMALDRVRESFYEWLANLLLNAPRATQKQRLAGVRRGLQRQLDASRKRINIFDCCIDLIKAGTPERQINKRIAKKLGMPTEYVRKARRSAYKEK